MQTNTRKAAENALALLKSRPTWMAELRRISKPARSICCWLATTRWQREASRNCRVAAAA